MPILGNGGHGVMQDAVNAVFDGDFLIPRLDMNVAGSPFQGIEDGGIDQLDDRGDVVVGRGKLIDGEGFVLIFLVGDDVQGKAFGDFFKNALALLGLLEKLGDLRESGDLYPEFLIEQKPELVDGVEIPRIGQRDIERAVLPLQRDKVVAKHQIDGDMAEQIVIDGRFAEIDVFAAIARGDRLSLSGFPSGVVHTDTFSGHKG